MCKWDSGRSKFLEPLRTVWQQGVLCSLQFQLKFILTQTILDFNTQTRLFVSRRNNNKQTLHRGRISAMISSQCSTQKHHRSISFRYTSCMHRTSLFCCCNTVYISQMSCANMLKNPLIVGIFLSLT